MMDRAQGLFALLPHVRLHDDGRHGMLLSRMALNDRLHDLLQLQFVHCFLAGEKTTASYIVGLIDVGLTSSIGLSFLFNGLVDTGILQENKTSTFVVCIIDDFSSPICSRTFVSRPCSEAMRSFSPRGYVALPYLLDKLV